MEKIVFLVLALAAIFALLGVGPSRRMKEAYNDDSTIASDAASSYAKKGLVKKSANQYSFCADLFWGVKKVSAVKVAGGIVLGLDIRLNSGRFKAVLVDKDANIYTLADGATLGEVSLDIPDGDYILKIVGEEAAAECVIRF